MCLQGSELHDESPLKVPILALSGEYIADRWRLRAEWGTLSERQLSDPSPAARAADPTGRSWPDSGLIPPSRERPALTNRQWAKSDTTRSFAPGDLRTA